MGPSVPKVVGGAIFIQNVVDARPETQGAVSARVAEFLLTSFLYPFMFCFITIFFVLVMITFLAVYLFIPKLLLD